MVQANRVLTQLPTLEMSSDFCISAVQWKIFYLTLTLLLLLLFVRLEISIYGTNFLILDYFFFQNSSASFHVASISQQQELFHIKKNEAENVTEFRELMNYEFSLFNNVRSHHA